MEDIGKRLVELTQQFHALHAQIAMRVTEFAKDQEGWFYSYSLWENGIRRGSDLLDELSILPQKLELALQFAVDPSRNAALQAESHIPGYPGVETLSALLEFEEFFSNVLIKTLEDISAAKRVSSEEEGNKYYKEERENIAAIAMLLAPERDQEVEH